MAAILPPDPLPPDENVGPILVGVSTALVLVALLAGGLRLWVRYAHLSLGWDDYLMMAVLPIMVTRLVIQGVQLEYGNGRHRWYLDEHDYQTNDMLGWYSQHTLFAGMCLLKCSIIFLLLRIKSTKTLKWLLGAVMAGLVITNGGCMIILLSECRPISAYWTREGECWDNRIRIYSVYVTISYSLATDLMCSLLPLVVVWRVRIPRSTKIAVCCLMSLGLIATGFGVARAASLGVSTADLSYVFAYVAIWSNLEFFLGIIAANLALSRQIYGHLTGKGIGATVQPSPYRLGRSNGSVVTNGSRSTNLVSNLRSDHVHRPDTYIRATSTERPSLSRSDGSDIALKPNIQKKTEFWLTEEESYGKNSPDRRSSDAVITK